MRALERPLDGRPIAHVGLHRADLADAAERLEMAGKIGTPHGDTDAMTTLGQRTHHVAADEAGSTENRHQRFGWLLPAERHGALRGYSHWSDEAS
ncbi:hypothetical protein GCM10010994_00890 [Chelatococcus reniformis]|uniref:Uncharacterized protein n=1 Tax=Chelatococcus reniformis TaxID=1494448 RepID=A0A916X6P7_9HYPH|nr:hypothetical protein GCM10010994_00890 [Chelatococcus reniformis]